MHIRKCVAPGLRSFMVRGLAGAPGDVILGQLLAWTGKNCLGLTELGEMSQPEKSRPRRDARGLLHIMRHNDNKAMLFSFRIRSLISRVAIGSSAEQRSSIKMTSGLQVRIFPFPLLIDARAIRTGSPRR